MAVRWRATIVLFLSAGTRGTANRIAQVAVPFGASLIAAVAGAGGIFVIIAASLVASGAAVYWSRTAKADS